jgi:FkbM family methyltransferase
MKKLIKSAAAYFGIRISRMRLPWVIEDPLKAMQHLLKDSSHLVIFDVGAHHGHVALKFRELFPKAKIYAFEPFPESYDHLVRNTESDPDIYTFPFGLSDVAGARAFQSNANSATNSLLPTSEGGAETWAPGLLETKNVVEASFETVDSVVAMTKVPQIDILKIDTQGAETLVMAGASLSLERKLIGMVYSEFILQPTYVGQKRFDVALSKFYDSGFDLYNVYNLSHTQEGRLRQLDAIFTRQPSPT